MQEQVIAILRAGETDPQFNELVLRLLSSLQRLLRRAEPKVADLAEDAAERAVENLRRKNYLDSIAQGAFDQYAWRTAYRVLVRLARQEKRLADLKTELSRCRENKERHLAESLPFRGRSVEELAEVRERLYRAVRIVRQSEVAWWRLVEQLSEKEIERRTGLTRDQIRSIVRRILKKIRGDDGSDPSSSGGASIQ